MAASKTSISSDRPDSTTRYLYRTCCDESNGKNEANLFEPALKARIRPITKNGSTFAAKYGTLTKQLPKALWGGDADENPFVFSTSSLLWTLQHAFKQAKRGSKKPKVG